MLIAHWKLCATLRIRRGLRTSGGLGKVRQTERLYYFRDERWDAGFGRFSVGWEAKISKGLGCDRANGNAQNFLWKTETGSLK